MESADWLRRKTLDSSRQSFSVRYLACQIPNTIALLPVSEQIELPEFVMSRSHSLSHLIYTSFNTRFFSLTDRLLSSTTSDFSRRRIARSIVSEIQLSSYSVPPALDHQSQRLDLPPVLDCLITPWTQGSLHERKS